MNSINKIFSTSNIAYFLVAIAVAAVMVFAVLPQLPQVASTMEKATVAASSVLAYSGGGGDGGCCGGNDGGGYNPGDGGGYTPTPPPVVVTQPVKCNYLNASRTTVPHGGANVTLSWSTSNANSANLSGVGSVPVNGSRTVFVDSTRTFTLTAYGAATGGAAIGGGGGSVTSHTCTVRITVEAPKPPAKCEYLTASRTTVPYGGANVTLSWSTNNATSASLSGVGSVPVNGTRTVFVDSARTFTLTAVGTGGNDTCTVAIKVAAKPIEKPAKCDYLNTNRTTVPHGGGNVVLSWKTTDANSVSISGVGSVANTGSITVFVNSNRTFTLTAVGAGGNDTCTVSIKVATKPVEKPAKCEYLNASRTTVPHDGGNVTLSWNTTNANSVSISGVGNVANSGSVNVFVNSTRTFTLTAVGTDGNDTCTVTVTTGNKPVEKPVKCDYLNASKTVVSENGENITLSWSTKNATNVRISGVGTVGQSGSRSVFVNGNTTFTLTATGDAGSDTCSVTITTKTSPIGETPRCDYLRVSNSGKIERGDRVTLTWGTTNADDVRIEPRLGSVSRNGSETVTIYDDVTTFTLTARNFDSGREATCTVTVRVDKDYEEPSKKTPRCDLEVSKTRVNRGEKVTLKWDTTNAKSLRIRDDRGTEIYSTSNSRYLDGEIDVVINRTTEFIMTVNGVDGGSRTCRVEVKTDDIAVYEKREQGMVIALTQVPYTGFEAGPFLTFIFYAMLVLWALFISYILVIKKSSVLGFSLYGNEAAKAAAAAEIEHRKKVEALVAKYTGRGW